MEEPLDWQRMAADFARAHDLLRDPVTHALDLSSEVAEACDINAGLALRQALTKYERRLAQKEDAGST